MAEKNNKKFSIENLPESTRKKIFVLSVLILSLAIVIFWLFTFLQAIENTKVGPETEEAKEIKQDLKNMFNEAQSGVDNIKEQLEEIPNPGIQTTKQEKILENNQGNNN